MCSDCLHFLFVRRGYLALQPYIVQYCDCLAPHLEQMPSFKQLLFTALAMSGAVTSAMPKPLPEANGAGVVFLKDGSSRRSINSGSNTVYARSGSNTVFEPRDATCYPDVTIPCGCSNWCVVKAQVDETVWPCERICSKSYSSRFFRYRCREPVLMECSGGLLV